MEQLKQYSYRPDKRSLKSINISLASPENIRRWSSGEVKKPETINYRTQKPEDDGLFCAKIFGPIKDYECLCGKYKKIKDRGATCERCGVEVIPSNVRRQRMGHIELASPVAHIWFLKSLPSRLGLYLDIPLKDMEKIVYYQSYVVVDTGNSEYERGDLITYEQIENYRNEAVDDFDFKAEAGAEAILKLIENIDIKQTIASLREQITKARSENTIKKISKRLKLFESFARSDNDPSWMILKVLPVLPPELRPLVPLEGGRFATSDLNDGYRKVINRNKRLKTLLNLHAPEVIIHNEKRMLQEAVDHLLDNTKNTQSPLENNRRKLKSLVDMIKGKQGRFRQNLLGKRVDYSGRSVIVVGPKLRLHQCGLPKKMAIELFKPFVFHQLMAKGHANTIRSAKRIVEEETSEVWNILAEVIHQHPIILNRAPTLHRLGIQAFEPVLIEGKALQLHPLVCSAYNADFDGDQMGVYVPLSYEAQQEARVLMMSSNNILSPANGAPIIVPSQDIVLGLYYLTREDDASLDFKGIYADKDEVMRAYNAEIIKLHDKIKVRIINYDSDGSEKESKIYDTTVGRVILSQIVPEGIDFDAVNLTMKKKEINDIIALSHKLLTLKSTVIFADQLMYLGFEYATKSGISISLSDLQIPDAKKDIIHKAGESINQIERDFSKGLLTRGEKYNKTIDTWSDANDEIGAVMMEGISSKTDTSNKKEKRKYKSFNSVYMMADSGARGSESQIRQLAGMRGLMARPDGSIIETAVTSNFREGLSVLQYFICTHGARKGLADTALKTASSGYLTRRLVDVSQDLIVYEEDCGTTEGIRLSAVIEGGDTIVPLSERVYGRVAAQDVYGDDGKVVLPAGTYFDDDATKLLEEHNVEEIIIRSAVKCEAKFGICRKCYGIDLARGNVVNRGEAVGVIAAQSIGEPGTQLTMRTFYTGGAASKSLLVDNITVKFQGKVKFENINWVKRADEGDLVVISRSGKIKILNNQNREIENYPVPYGASVFVEDGDEVQAGKQIATWDAHSLPIIAEESGTVKFADFEENISVKQQTDDATGFYNIEIINQAERTAAGKLMRPTIYLTDKDGKAIINSETGQEISYVLPSRSVVSVVEGQVISRGTPIARIAVEEQKSQDITGGLPRVAALFEARIPKDSSVMAPCEGIVQMGRETKDKIKIIFMDDNGKKIDEISIAKRRNINVLEGQKVSAGDLICEGSDNPHDILKYQGVEALTEHIVQEVQKVYRLQGVKINDKHIEVIVSQMLRKVRVTDPGDSSLVAGEQVEVKEINKINKQLQTAAMRQVECERILLGITNAALSTDSFISAASFQDTTRVLTDAAINSKQDVLRGLKENVVVGCLIPAGTGYFYYEMLKEKERRRAMMSNQSEELSTISESEREIIYENISSDLAEDLGDKVDATLLEESVKVQEN